MVSNSIPPKGIRPSKSLKRVVKLNIKDKIYSFNKRVNRISYLEQIPQLFDEPNKIDKKEGKGIYGFEGEVSGVFVKIDFSLRRPCYIYTRSEEDLNQVYEKILERLINRN